MPQPPRDVLDQLLKDARITGPRLEKLVNCALDVHYWRALSPDLHVEDAAPMEVASVAGAAIDESARALRDRGYFRLAGVIAPDGVRRLNAAIDAVTRAGWPASFVFMYDEAWHAARSPAVRRLLVGLLGPGFLQIRHVWAHVVEPVAGASGWSPHVDGDGRGRLTVWMALSDATLENGCMHVVPRDVTAALPGLIERFGTDHSQFSRAEVVSLLHGTHALVAAPGDALGWGFDVIHWGGVARRAGQARRSLSFEYIAANERPTDTDGPLSSMDVLPSFADRLRSVATAVTSYRKFEPLVDRFADVAREIVARLS